MDGDFVDTSLMATSFKGGIQIDCENGLCLLFGEEASREGEDVGIVVLTSQLCNLDVPAEGCTNDWIFVHHHRYAIAGATDGDPAAQLATLDGCPQWVSIVRIVHAVGGVAAEVFHCDTTFCEPAFDLLFEAEAGVVAANTDCFHYCWVDV